MVERLPEDFGKERIPRAKGEAATKLMAPDHRLDSHEDRWHVLAACLGGASWQGVPILKQQFDLRRYFDLLADRRPEVVVETGMQSGGSALFFMDALRMVGLYETLYVGVDLDCKALHPSVLEYPHPHVVIRRDCLHEETVRTVGEYVKDKRALMILDSVHSEEHVAEELRLYAPLITPGSHLVIEDTDHSGHPILKEYTPSAWHAVEKFLSPDGLGTSLGYVRDYDVEEWFTRHGTRPFTVAPGAWLRRNDL